MAKKPVSKRTTKVKKSTTVKKAGLMQTTYGLSEALQAVVGAKKLTRPQVVKKIWEYIKKHKCQDTKNRRMIVPDIKLSKVLGNKAVDMLKMSGILNKHIEKN